MTRVTRLKTYTDNKEKIGMFYSSIPLRYEARSSTGACQSWGPCQSLNVETLSLGDLGDLRLASVLMVKVPLVGVRLLK